MPKYFFRGVLNDPQLSEISKEVKPVAYMGLWIWYELLVGFSLVE